VVQELNSVVAPLRSNSGGLRWVEPKSWHITLQFLGNATPEQHACLTARLGEVRSAPVPVELGSLGCFEPAGDLFADVAVTPGLVALAEGVVAATGQCGFAAETRPFHPHITLARAKGRGHGVGRRTLASGARTRLVFSRFTAQEFLLYESHLRAEGARYEVRGRFPLHEP
jgi:2'-5' RNA ligase